MMASSPEHEPCLKHTKHPDAHTELLEIAHSEGLTFYQCASCGSSLEYHHDTFGWNLIAQEQAY